MQIRINTHHNPFIPLNPNFRISGLDFPADLLQFCGVSPDTCLQKGELKTLIIRKID